MASGFVLNIVLARMLGSVKYGLYAIVLGFLTAANLTQTQGVPYALSKGLAEGRTDVGALWTAAVRVQRVASVLGVGVFVVLAPVVALVLDDQQLLWGLLLAALAIPGYASYATWSGYLNGVQAFRRLSG